MKKEVFDTVHAQASYGIGLQIGQQLQDAGIKELDADAISVGIRDVIAGNSPKVSLDVLRSALEQVHQKAAEEVKETARVATTAGKEFLADNVKKLGITVTESGLQYKIIKQGNGAKPSEDDRVRVQYTGRLIDGTVFDSSVERNKPAEFPVNGVIPGWVEALQLMPVGSKWQLYIPQELAYGERGVGETIPPYSTLIFDVELLDIL